jgi:hypothetical protein
MLVVLATSTPPSANAPSVAVIRVSCIRSSSGRDVLNVRRPPSGRQAQRSGSPALPAAEQRGLTPGRMVTMNPPIFGAVHPPRGSGRRSTLTVIV